MLHNNTLRRQTLATLIAVLMLVALMVVLVGAQPAQAQGKKGARILAPDQKWYGRTYGEWSAQWWQWAMEVPYSQGALTDETGARCGVNQSGPVWFLAGVGNSSGTVTRNCTTPIPAGKALLIPILNVEWDNEAVPEPGLTEGELRAIAAGIIDHTANLSFSVDGVPVTDFEAYRVTSPLFYYTMSPTDNVYGLTCAGTPSPTCKDKDGNTVDFAGLEWTNASHKMVKAVSAGDGYYVMLAPLPKGEHTIHFGGTFTDWGYTLDITYHITVK